MGALKVSKRSEILVVYGGMSHLSNIKEKKLNFETNGYS